MMLGGGGSGGSGGGGGDKAGEGRWLPSPCGRVAGG